jgi:acyl-coenzyme A synthetase/AMP-(fatty) acid ligase
MNCGQILRKTGRLEPGALAVSFEGRRMTYGEVYERSCRLVNALRALGIRPQDRVATLGPNTAHSLEQIGGLALGGFVRVPLHYRNPAEVHRYMLEHVGARALITDSANYRELRDSLAELPALEFVIVDDGEGPLAYGDLLASVSGEDPQVVVRPQDMIHMTFTSGTTGRPKATVQTHRSWLAVTAENMIMLPAMTQDDRYLAASPLSHGGGSVLFALIARAVGNIVMPTYDPGQAAELIERHRVTVTVMAPTMVHRLIHDPAAAGRDLSSVRVIFAIGAAITEQAIREVAGTFGDVLYLGFGQSEGLPATILSPQEIRRGIEGEGSLLRSSGRPIPGSAIKVLDAADREVAAGELGEIAVDTPGNMKELWGEPEASAARFTGDGFIRTGDIGYVDDRGYLFVVGREGDAILCAGTRIWPAEVENAVASHPAVLEVAAVGFADPAAGQLPGAVVVLKDGHRASEEEIVAWCRERFAAEVSPVRVAFQTDPLPKSPVGKMLRRVVQERYGSPEREAIVGGRD